MAATGPRHRDGQWHRDTRRRWSGSRRRAGDCHRSRYRRRILAVRSGITIPRRQRGSRHKVNHKSPWAGARGDHHTREPTKDPPSQEEPMDDAVSVWPDLPYNGWRETAATLQLWTQIVGKVRLTLTPWLNQ